MASSSAVLSSSSRAASRAAIKVARTHTGNFSSDNSSMNSSGKSSKLAECFEEDELEILSSPVTEFLKRQEELDAMEESVLAANAKLGSQLKHFQRDAAVKLVGIDHVQKFEDLKGSESNQKRLAQACKTAGKTGKKGNSWF